MPTDYSPPKMLNALITTFPGLPNLTIPVLPTTSIATLHNLVTSHLFLPTLDTLPYLSRLHLSTTSGHILSPDSRCALTTLLNDANTHLLPLHLTSTLPGGKGGFGSQLRAAGGRMSSRKKRGQEENSDSCRNLDGRRIRTVKEAKALAAYLAIKPEMEKKEKEARRQRWLKIVEAADRREEEERLAGLGGAGVGLGVGGKRILDAEWREKTEEEKEKLREVVQEAMKEMMRKEKGEGSSSGSSGISSGGEGDGEDDDEEEERQGRRKMKVAAALINGAATTSAKKASPPKFAGFDDDDEFMSDDDVEDADEDDQDEEMDDIEEDAEEEVEAEAAESTKKGKGKAKA